MCKMLTLGELREGPRPLGRLQVTSCEFLVELQVRTKSTQAGHSVKRQDDSRGSVQNPCTARGDVYKPEVHSPAPRLPGPELAKAEPRGGWRGTATFDWTGEVSVRPRGLGIPGGLGRIWSRVWSEAEFAGRKGGEEGGAKRPAGRRSQGLVDTRPGGEREGGQGGVPHAGTTPQTPGFSSLPLLVLYPARISVAETRESTPSARGEATRNRVPASGDSGLCRTPLPPLVA